MESEDLVRQKDPLALPMDVDDDGFPLVHKFKTRIDDLEHRLDFLERRFNPNQYGDGRARIIGEIQALKAALVVMRYHELEVAGETSVITALERLVDAHEHTREYSRSHAMREALAMAKHVLGELVRKK